MGSCPPPISEGSERTAEDSTRSVGRTTSTGVRAIAQDVVDSVSALGSSIKQGDTVKLDAVAKDVSKIVDGLQALPKEAGREAMQAAVDFRQEITQTAATLRSAVPTRAQVGKAIYSAEVSSHVIQSPLLLGLFVPPPEWPPQPYTVRALLRNATIPAFLVGGALSFAIFVLVLLALLTPLLMPFVVLLAPLLVPLLLLARSRRAAAREERRQYTEASEATARALAPSDWREKPAAFFSTNTKASRERRRRVSESILADIVSRSVKEHDSAFNEYVRQVKGIAVYGCGVVAATHVGALRALERHGLDYTNVETYAGVSAGSIVVSMLAVGANAEKINTLIQNINFTRIVTPEVGALLRSAVNNFLTVVEVGAVRVPPGCHLSATSGSHISEPLMAHSH